MNVEGTRVLLDGVSRLSPGARVVFSSSVSVYRSSVAARPHRHSGRSHDARRPLRPLEGRVRETCQGVGPRLDSFAYQRRVGAGLSGSPPSEWPFLPDQQIEFVHRDDAVSALIAAADPSVPTGRSHIISGGSSWRMTGAHYVEDFFRLVEVDPEDAVYQSDPGHFAWYGTSDSQNQLSYQNTSYSEYLDQMRANIEALMAG